MWLGNLWPKMRWMERAVVVVSFFDALRKEAAWMSTSGVKCKGVTSFFYPSKSNTEVAAAKAVCNGQDGSDPCPMLETCRNHAIDNRESWGVWGGLSERERRKIQRARNKYKDPMIYTLEQARFPGRVTIARRTTKKA